MCVHLGLSQRLGAREQLEDLLITIANDLEHGLIVTQSGEIILVNDLVAEEFAQHLPPGGREAALGKKLTDLFPPDRGVELLGGGWRGRGVTDCLYEYRPVKEADGLAVYSVTKVQRQWRARLREEPCAPVAEPEPLSWLLEAFQKR